MDELFLLKFNEQVIDHFLIPSFTLSKGEIVILHFPNMPASRNVELTLAGIFQGKIHNNNVEVITPLTWVEPLKENGFRYHFWPTTVGAYLNKYANKASPIAQKIYEIEWMTPKIKIKTLAGNPRKRLSLYKSLSWTHNIVFDLAGVDPLGGLDIYGFVKTIVQSGGAAILLDRWDEYKEDCTKFIQVKYLNGAM